MKKTGAYDRAVLNNYTKLFFVMQLVSCFLLYLRFTKPNLNFRILGFSNKGDPFKANYLKVC